MTSLKKIEFTPILGWSVSRYDTFRLCKRKYFHTYYSKYDPTHSRAKIESLKNMTSIPLEIGNIVHDVCKTLLERLRKTETDIDKARFFEYARRKTEQYCEKTFMEIYYEEVARINIDDIFDKVRISLNNFLTSPRFDWLIREAVTNKAEWLIEPPGFGETRIEGMKAYCKVDFLFPVKDEIHIMDWKTGKPDEQKHRKQLVGYAAWASFHYKVDPAKITPIIAHLFPEYEETRIGINEFDIVEFSGQVKAETDEMYEYCENIPENIPKSKEVFAKTPNKALCGYCNFRELCV